MRTEWSVTIATEGDIVAARQQARQAAKDLGFGAVDQSRIATAVSEIARNVVKYATGGQGQMEMRVIGTTEKRPGLEIVVRDEGPGIANVDQAMREGFSTGGSLGMGLSGARRLMDEMEIDSVFGRGTTVVMRKWRR